RVSAYSSLVNEPINIEMAEIALRDLAPDSAAEQITPNTIIEVTAEYFDIDVSTLTGSGKKRDIAHARQLAMYLCRRSEEHTSELQSRFDLVCRLLLEKTKL